MTRAGSSSSRARAWRGGYRPRPSLAKRPRRNFLYGDMPRCVCLLKAQVPPVFLSLHHLCRESSWQWEGAGLLFETKRERCRAPPRGLASNDIDHVLVLRGHLEVLTAGHNTETERQSFLVWTRGRCANDSSRRKRDLRRDATTGQSLPKSSRPASMCSMMPR